MEFIIALFIFSTSATITPGPNNIMLMTSGLNFGALKTLPHYLGVCVGFPVMVVLLGLGFGFLFERFPVLHQVIQLIGFLYLLYLSWLIANAAPSTLDAEQVKPLTFFQAVLFQWVNPKAWIMATGAIAAFTSESADIFIGVLIIALTFLVVTFPCSGLWLFFGVWLKKLFKNPAHQKTFNRLMACLLVLSIMPGTYDLIRNLIN